MDKLKYNKQMTDIYTHMVILLVLTMHTYQFDMHLIAFTHFPLNAFN